jgi:hypothetical protein
LQLAVFDKVRFRKQKPKGELRAANLTKTLIAAIITSHISKTFVAVPQRD